MFNRCLFFSKSVVDASEDSQLEAAIRASLQQQTSKPAESESDGDDYFNNEDEIETFSGSEEEAGDDKEKEVKSKSASPVKWSKKDKSSKPKSVNEIAATDSGPSTSNSCDSFYSRESSSLKSSDTSLSATYNSTVGAKRTSNGVANTDSQDSFSTKSEGDTSGTEKWKFYLGNQEGESVIGKVLFFLWIVRTDSAYPFM